MLGHEWTEGARFFPVVRGRMVEEPTELATCAHCETLRVSNPPYREAHYIRRRACECRNEGGAGCVAGGCDRVVLDEPPCLAAPRHFQAPW